MNKREELGNTHTPVTEAQLEALGKESLFLCQDSEREYGIVYISKPFTIEKIREGVSRFLSEQDQLFLSKGFELDIFTQQIHSPREQMEVEALCNSAGFKVLDIKKVERKGKYLYSDGPGHYSIDFYEYTVFGVITLIGA